MPFPRVKVRKRREVLGLSRKQVADAVGLAPRALEALEQGITTNPGLETVRQLCAALSVPPEFFFTDDLPDDQSPVLRGRPKKPADPPAPATPAAKAKKLKGK